MASMNMQSTTDASVRDLSSWLSTYGVVTVEKILDRYSIKMSTVDLIATLKNPAAMLTRMIQTPLKNVLNGLVLQQVKDYQGYIEKLFIDYLLSGETEQENESLTMEDIEQVRQDFLQLMVHFQQSTYRHEKLIADSQTILIDFFKQFHQKMNESVKKAQSLLKRNGHTVAEGSARIQELLYALMSGVNTDGFLEDKSPAWLRYEQLLGSSCDNALRKDWVALIDDLNQVAAETTAQLTNYYQIATEVGIAIKNYRIEFANTIKRVNELFYALGTYHPDPTQLAKNQIAMDFDTDIG